MSTEDSELAALFSKIGYSYPQDVYYPPPGVEEYCALEHVTAPPARDAEGNILEAGSKRSVQRFVAPPDGIVIIRNTFAAPKNRTAVESSHSQYRGVVETKGRSLFCAPGTGSDVRIGTIIGISNVIIFPKGILEILVWNLDPCSEAKWSFWWNSYLLKSR